MHHTTTLVAAASLAVGGCATEAPETSTTESAVTIHDVDFAPECEGIISYVNWAPFDELDRYLPVSLVDALIDRRLARPFDSLADLSSVPGVAQGRLAQFTNRAWNLDFIDGDCAGTFEELAVSHSDRAKIFTYVNTAPEAELATVARSEGAATAAAIVAGRPYTSLHALVAVEGIGPSTFRSIRNAAIEDPFDIVVGRVNAVADSHISLNFDWFALMFEQPGQQGSMVCFGVPANVVASFGGVMRPNLADGAEVLAEVTSTVGFANRFGQVGDSSAGLAHLSAQVTGHAFLGCYISYHPDPWSGVNRAFFVDKDTGYRVFTETRWSE